MPIFTSNFPGYRPDLPPEMVISQNALWTPPKKGFLRGFDGVFDLKRIVPLFIVLGSRIDI